MPINENGIFRSRVLDGLWLQVEWLWQDPQPPVLQKEWGVVYSELHLPHDHDTWLRGGL
ncbi:MAG: hypothetical protein HY231_07785 [Acidobacteria bacterium]|nr:hypothetical protein [Acidobacteriota bacterium]